MSALDGPQGMRWGAASMRHSLPTGSFLALALLLLMSTNGVADSSFPQMVAEPPTVVVDVAKEFGISFSGIGAAMLLAQQLVAKGSSAIVYLSAGVHSVDMAAGDLFNVSGPVPPAGCKLIVAGAGMDDTTLLTQTHGHNVIFGRGFHSVSFVNLTFARPGPTTTQGTVKAVEANHLDIELHEGFPNFNTLLLDRYPRLKTEQGLFIRRFIVPSDNSSEPQIVTGPDGGRDWPPSDNVQVHFACEFPATRHNASAWDCDNITRLDPPGSKGPGLWRLHVARWPRGELEAYRRASTSAGVFAAIKVKHGGQAFMLREGNFFRFSRVRWLGHSRGAIYDASNVVIEHTRIDRAPATAATHGVTPFLATNGGGPQLINAQNVTVFNHTATGTGDDSLAFFNISSGSIHGCHISDSFARGILLCNVGKDVLLGSDNVVVRCPIYRPSSTSYQGCG